MIDGTGMDVGNGKASTLSLHKLVSIIRTEINNALTSSVDSSMSKFIQKWAKHLSKGSS